MKGDIMPSPVPHHRWSVDAPLLHPERRLFLHLLPQDLEFFILLFEIIFKE